MTANTYKLLLTPLGSSAAAENARRWARSLPQVLDAVTRVEFDAITAEGQETHDRATSHEDRKPQWTVIVSVWGGPPPDQGPAGYDMTVLTVEDRIGYGFGNDRPGPVEGYKKMSFWKAKAGLGRSEWDPLYAHHIVTVPHLQPIWRYRQNMIVSKPPALPFDAISENWWLTLRDLSDGFFFSAEAKEAVYAETKRFIDFDVTMNFISRNEVLFIAGADS